MLTVHTVLTYINLIQSTEYESPSFITINTGYIDKWKAYQRQQGRGKDKSVLPQNLILTHSDNKSWSVSFVGLFRVNPWLNCEQGLACHSNQPSTTNLNWGEKQCFKKKYQKILYLSYTK